MISGQNRHCCCGGAHTVYVVEFNACLFGSVSVFVYACMHKCISTGSSLMAFKEFSLCAQASIHMPWLERSAPSKRACYMTWPEAAKKDITGQDSSQERWIALEVLAVNFQWFCNGVYYNALYILVNLFVGFVACIVTWVIDVIQTSVLVCVCALLHFVWRLQLTAEQCGSRLVLVGWLTVWKREREREREMNAL